jgi:hypothetical protein
MYTKYSNYYGLYRSGKKTGVLHVNSEVLKTLLRPPSCTYADTRIEM